MFNKLIEKLFGRWDEEFLATATFNYSERPYGWPEWTKKSIEFALHKRTNSKTKKSELFGRYGGDEHKFDLGAFEKEKKLIPLFDLDYLMYD